MGCGQLTALLFAAYFNAPCVRRIGLPPCQASSQPLPQPSHVNGGRCGPICGERPRARVSWNRTSGLTSSPRRAVWQARLLSSVAKGKVEEVADLVGRDDALDFIDHADQASLRPPPLWRPR